MAMAYVAEDPKQPGAAWAITMIDPKWAKDTAETLAQWVKDGAIIKHVDLETGKAMLMKWVRPSKTAGGEQQGLL